MRSLLWHIFSFAELYTIGLVWIVLPLAGWLAYLRLSHVVRTDEDVDALP